jgi:hypothetical protein
MERAMNKEHSGGVAIGERFIMLSDPDVWETTDACEVCIFLQDFETAEPHTPESLCHAEFVRATVEGKVWSIPLDRLIDHYIRSLILARSAEAKS